MPIVTCKRSDCNNIFNRFPYEIKRGTKMYCSQICASIAQWSGVPRKIPTTITKKCKRDNCENEFVATIKSKKQYCSNHCRGIRRYITQGYISLSGMYEHPLSTLNGVVLEHRLALWNKLKCTKLDCIHQCNWCNKDLFWGGLNGIQADHLDSNKQNNIPKNLVVSCAKCNLIRRHKSASIA